MSRTCFAPIARWARRGAVATAFAAAMSFTSHSAHAVNLLAGGGFDSAADLANWNVGNDGGGADPVITLGPAFGLGPESGAGYLGFTGNDVNENGYVEQTVAVTPGEVYALNFFYSTRGSSPTAVTVTGSGASTGDLLSEAFDATAVGVWSEATEYFVPTTNSVTIRFQESSANSQSKGPGVDTASLVEVPTAMTMLDIAEFTTAAENDTVGDDSPAEGGQFASPLYVRERANENNPELEVEAFLKFDLSGLSDSEILNATLVLNQDHKLNNVNSADLSIARVLEAWDSSGNDPVFAEETTSNDGVGGITDVADEFVFGNNGPASAGPAVDITHVINLTDWVKLWQADASSNHGVRLRIDDGFVGASFASAQLIIKQVLPEPATASLAVIGAAGLLLRRRRAC